MANKRELKHTLTNVCDSLLAECIANLLYGPKRDQEYFETITWSIVKIHKDFISKVSHPEPGLPKKKYYKILKKEFYEQIIEITDQINNPG